MVSEERTILAAIDLATRHVGVPAWNRTIDPQFGEYGDPVELARYGVVPEMH